MEHRGASQAAWRKSTYSGGATNCVEVAGNLPATVAVRDSKKTEESALTFALGTWHAFTSAVKNGEYDKRLGLSAWRDSAVRVPPGRRRDENRKTTTERGGHGGNAAGRFPRD